MARKMTAQGIDSAYEDWEIERRNFLRERGWEYTCDTPGSLWLMRRTLPDGRVMLVDEDTAMSIERHTEE